MVEAGGGKEPGPIVVIRQKKGLCPSPSLYHIQNQNTRGELGKQQREERRNYKGAPRSFRQVRGPSCVLGKKDFAMRKRGEGELASDHWGRRCPTVLYQERHVSFWDKIVSFSGGGRETRNTEMHLAQGRRKNYEKESRRTKRKEQPLAVGAASKTRGQGGRQK